MGHFTQAAWGRSKLARSNLSKVTWAFLSLLRHPALFHLHPCFSAQQVPPKDLTDPTESEPTVYSMDLSAFSCLLPCSPRAAVAAKERPARQLEAADRIRSPCPLPATSPELELRQGAHGSSTMQAPRQCPLQHPTHTADGAGEG